MCVKKTAPNTMFLQISFRNVGTKKSNADYVSSRYYKYKSFTYCKNVCCDIRSKHDFNIPAPQSTINMSTSKFHIFDFSPTTPNCDFPKTTQVNLELFLFSKNILYLLKDINSIKFKKNKILLYIFRHFWKKWGGNLYSGCVFVFSKSNPHIFGLGK